MRPQRAGAQVDGAVGDVEQPRVAVELFVVDDHARHAAGEFDHGGDGTGGAGSQSPTPTPAWLPSCLVSQRIGGELEQGRGDTLGEFGDECILLVEDPAAVGVDEPLAPGVDVAELVPGVPDEPGGVADLGGLQPVWEWPERFDGDSCAVAAAELPVAAVGQPGAAPAAGCCGAALGARSRPLRAAAGRPRVDATATAPEFTRRRPLAGCVPGI